MTKWAVLLSVSVLVCGCSTGSMHVRRAVDGTKDPTGLRVQVPVPHDIYAVLQSPKGERVVQHASISLPSDEEFYDVGYEGGKFNSAVLSVSVHPNGALNEYSLTTKNLAAEQMEASAGAISEISAARLAIREDEAPAAPPTDAALLEASNQLTLLRILKTMLEENEQALADGEPLPWPGILGLASADGAD